MIFGFSQVDISKDTHSLCWVVRHPKTKNIIVRVALSHLFTWETLLSSSHAEDLFSIIEAGVGLDGWPSSEELARLEKIQPGVTLKTPLIDPTNLDSLRKNWVISPPEAPSSSNGVSKRRKSRPLQGKRKYIL